MRLGMDEFVGGLARTMNIPQAEAKRVMDAVCKEILHCCIDNGNEVVIRNFGAFRVVNTKPREGRNPRTGEKVNIPAKKRFTFRAAKGVA